MLFKNVTPLGVFRHYILVCLAVHTTVLLSGARSVLSGTRPTVGWLNENRH